MDPQISVEARRRRVRRFLSLAGLLVLALVATACVTQGGQMQQSPLLAALERKSGLIAYMGTDGNIYTINQGGGEETAITDDARASTQEGGNEGVLFYQLPTWAPDSEKIAFVSLESQTGVGGEAKIFTALPDGSELTEVYQGDDPPFYLYWSPENALTWLEGAPSGLLRLQMVPSGGGDVRLLDVGSPYYWAWSPNGRQLLSHVGASTRDVRLALLSLEEPVIETVLDFQPGIFQSPAWSPSGAQLLLAAITDDGEAGLMLTDASGEGHEILASLSRDGFVAFDWSPDGRLVAYVASEDALGQGTQGKLRVLDAGDPDQPLATVEEEVAAFFWSPDGEKIAYFVPFEIPNDTEETEASQEEAPQEEAIQDAQQPALFDLHVLELESGESSHILGPFQPTPPFLQVIAFFNQYQRSATIWSPDNENLVISATAQGQSAILVVAASGNLEPRAIASGLLAFWSWE